MANAKTMSVGRRKNPGQPGLRIPANTGPHYWYNPTTKAECSFRPTGPMHLVGPRKNPADVNAIWRGGGGVLAARLFVGLNVQDEPRWTVDDVINITVEMRKQQGHIPDSSFLTQKGVYTSKRTKKLVFEDSVQVIIINPNDKLSQEEFGDEMAVLAEELATRLIQEVVIVDVQANGLSIQNMGIGPRAGTFPPKAKHIARKKA